MYDSLCSVFSQKRLETYLNAANQDKEQALDLYKLNLRLSEALYPLLSILEITLRNRISSVLVQHFGESWFEGFEGKWFDGQSLPPPKKNYCYNEIQRVKNDLSGKIEKITSDRLTAELNFGFWTAILDGYYERMLWQKDDYIKEVFRNAPKNYNLKRNRPDIQKKLGTIRDLRNRVFHYEPLFGTYNQSFDNLFSDYANAKKLLGWLSQDSLKLLESQERFNDAVELIPSNMRESIKRVIFRKNSVIQYLPTFVDNPAPRKKT